MDDDFDVLSLAIESVESEIDHNTAKSNSLIKYPDNCQISNEISPLLSDKDECELDIDDSKCKKVRSLVGIDLSFEDNEILENKSVEQKQDDLFPDKSLIHTGETDSSDDEDNKYFEKVKYDSSGKFIKNKLKNIETKSLKGYQAFSWKKNASNVNVSTVPENVYAKETKIDVNADPIFGIRIVNPIVSSQTIKEKMIGRTPVAFTKIKYHVSHGDLNNDWVIAAVIVKKLPPRVSQNGNNYSSWILSDLKNDLKTVFLFLFGKAHQELWKTAAGTVLAILNPSVLGDKSSSEYEAKLSIKSPDQVMIWGRSKDLGQCKVKKKNGEMCGAFVNSYSCEVCVYHVKQEYNKCKARAVFSSEGNINLRNKVLGKNEVFYAGKSFTAVNPSGSKRKTTVKDVARLKGLGTTIINVPEVVSVPNLQRSNEILKLLPSVNNPLNAIRPSDRKRLDQLCSKKTNKEIEKLSLDDSALKKCDFKDKMSENKEPTHPSLNLVNKAVLKKTVPGIKLPTLSNPESEIIFKEKSNNNRIQTPKSQTPISINDKLAPGNIKRGKTYLQKRFNNLVNMQLPHDKEKNQVSINLTASPTNRENHTNKKLSKNPEMFKDNLCETLNYNNKSGKTEVTLTKDNSAIRHHSSTCSSEISSNESHSTSTPKINAIKNKIFSGTSTPPNLMISKAKMKALMYVKAKGPISKENPANLKSEVKCSGIKRPFPSEDEEEDNKKSILSERFIQLMKQKSLHEDLIEMREYEQELAYFEKMEKKDRLEEKMLSTYKIECKAVKCLKCNYLWFSAADSCKAERHPLKVIDALKRFFKCGQCENRTVSLTIIPVLPCKKCSSTNWVRTAMIKEKVAKNDSLSIRGGEQKFVNSVITNAGLNLMVPDE